MLWLMLDATDSGGPASRIVAYTQQLGGLNGSTNTRRDQPDISIRHPHQPLPLYKQIANR